MLTSARLTRGDTVRLYAALAVTVAGSTALLAPVVSLPIAFLIGLVLASALIAVAEAFAPDA